MAAQQKAVCKNGHPRVPENLTSARNCKLCQAQRYKRHIEKDRQHFREKINGYRSCAREALADSYINLLIHIKTGLSYSEITPEDRNEHRRRLMEYRARRTSLCSA